MDLFQYIEHPEQLDRDSLYELRSLLARYPYYQSARLLFLQNLYLLHDPSFGEELRKAALYVADCRALFDMIEGKNYVIEPKERTLEEESNLQNSDRTLSLIDKFLRTLPKEKDQHKVPVNPAADYVGYLLQMEDLPQKEEAKPAEPNRADDLINQFLDTHTPDERVELPEEEESDVEENVQGQNEEISTDDSCLTETLAKIYIKQHRYEKALEIIRRINLKNPKKSAYFADQMRFLEKLIINNNKQ